MDKGYEKFYADQWSMTWNRRLCWLCGHKWLYIRSAEPIGPTTIECKRGRFCQCCDAFEDISSRLVEAPFEQPIALGGPYAEEDR